MKLESRQDYWESDSTFHPALQPQDEPENPEKVTHASAAALGGSALDGHLQGPTFDGHLQGPALDDQREIPGNPEISDDFDLEDDEELDEELDDDFDAPSTAPKGFTTFIWALVAIIALLATAAISFLLVK
ncbi:MAG: hypothetical protein LIO91_09920 [Bacteroidales bacterium]|nr:hypothetical protein [Bacteroidales bacterium]